VRTPKVRPPLVLDIPPKIETVDIWLVVGLDPSMSRTGFAMMYVDANSTNESNNWVSVGSVKPDDSSKPIWARAKAMSLYLQEAMLRAYNGLGVSFNIGLLISTEYPTPMNDFLVALNRILHVVLFDGAFPGQFSVVKILTTNASTLRSLMGLKARGATNKKENILRAYEFIDRVVWPGLDTDSCDAILLAMMGKYAAQIVSGYPGEVPERFKVSLCNAAKEAKGKGTRARIITKGLLHRTEYWYPYEKESYTLLVKDARRPTGKALTRDQFII